MILTRCQSLFYLLTGNALERVMLITTSPCSAVSLNASLIPAKSASASPDTRLLIATGSEYRKLGVIGEERLSGRGVSYCATCDGFFFRGREVAVVGGGDTAITDALELTQHCRKIYIIHRRDQLRATKALQEKAFHQPKIEMVWNTVVDEIIGDKMLSNLRLRNVKTGESSNLEVDGLFVAIGLKLNSQVFSQLVALDKAGFIITDELMKTSAPGLFAAGDVKQNSSRQVITAAGDGAAAASSAFKYLYE